MNNSLDKIHSKNNLKKIKKKVISVASAEISPVTSIEMLPISSAEISPVTSIEMLPISSSEISQMSSIINSPMSSLMNSHESLRKTLKTPEYSKVGIKLNTRIRTPDTESFLKNDENLNKLIKSFQKKYKLQKYMDEIYLEDNNEFKNFLNTMIFFYNENPIPTILEKKITKKFKDLDTTDKELIDKTYDKNDKNSSANYFVINYIFYTLYLIVKNLDNGFNNIDNNYKKNLRGKKLHEALLFNKTDRYNALSNYCHILLYMIFYNTEFMPEKIQKKLKKLFKISKKGDKFTKDCNNVLLNIKNKKIYVCNHPDKPTTISIATEYGIKKLFNAIAEKILINEALELSRKFSI